MKTKYTACLLAVLAFEIGCYDPHAHQSKIVREVEAAGSGDLTTFTQLGLRQWFGQRPELASRIFHECLPLMKTAQANWITTAEGATCQAAEGAASMIMRRLAPLPGPGRPS